MASTSIVALIQLGNALKAARRAAAMSSTDAGQVIDVSQATYSRIESGKRPVSPQELAKLGQAFGIGHPELAALQELVQVGRVVDKWWMEYRTDGTLSAEYENAIAFEDEAIRATEIQTQAVPGLLQTRRYAEAMLEGSTLRTDPDRIEALVEIRVKRQRRLEGPAPLKLIAITTEAVLHYEYGPSALHLEQLRHLREMCDHPQVTFRIVPYTAMTDMSSLNMYEFEEPSPPVAFMETTWSNVALDQPRKINQARRVIARASDRALSAEDTIKAIEQKMGAMA